MYLCSNTSAIDFNITSQVFTYAFTACSLIEKLAVYPSSAISGMSAAVIGMPANEDRLQMAVENLRRQREDKA